MWLQILLVGLTICRIRGSCHVGFEVSDKLWQYKYPNKLAAVRTCAGLPRIYIPLLWLRDCFYIPPQPSQFTNWYLLHIWNAEFLSFSRPEGTVSFFFPLSLSASAAFHLFTALEADPQKIFVTQTKVACFNPLAACSGFVWGIWEWSGDHLKRRRFLYVYGFLAFWIHHRRRNKARDEILSPFGCS